MKGPYVFAGPTLSPDDALGTLDAVYLPPAAQGDVYRAARQRPSAIGIIDGAFERVPAVWHKEILWALAQGIPVYGAASMGALRAAELAPFGMRGVGRIFAAFRDGNLEDDDEVAVVHGPAATGYAALSDAMVNIRATLERAELEGVIGPGLRDWLERTAKALHFADRAYGELLRRADAAGACPAELMALRAWLPAHRVDRKREDAFEMLRAMRSPAPAEPPAWTFEHTTYWEEAIRQAGALAPARAPDDLATTEALWDELRLQPGAWPRAVQEARLRHLALAEAERRGVRADEEAVDAVMLSFRRAHRLTHGAALSRWLRKNEISQGELRGLVRDEARLNLVGCAIAGPALDGLAGYLRLVGRYGPLLSRARDKRHVLAARGLDDDRLAPPVADAVVLEWYFRRTSLPCPGSLERFAHGAGFADVAALVRALRREYHYVRLSAPGRAGGGAPEGADQAASAGAGTLNGGGGGA